MDNLVLAARYRTYLLKVTYSFGDDLLNVEWEDVQGEPLFLLAVPQARERLLFILQRGGTVARRAIIIIAHFIRECLGIPVVPIGPKCVIFQATLSEDDEAAFTKFVESKEMEKKLQAVFADVEGYLREELGDDYGSLEESEMAELKKVKIVSVDLCETEEADRSFREFREPRKPVARQSLDEVVEQVIGKLGEESKNALNSKFGALGIKEPKHLRHLHKEKIAAELSGALKPVEIQELIQCAAGWAVPSPPVNLRLTSPEYSNTALTVFFDDPNKMMCDYIVTALDMESEEEVSVNSSSNFGVLKDLKPGRRYVIYAQCVSNDVRSKKTFFGDVIRVFGKGAEEADTSLDVTKYSTDIPRDVQSTPTIDSAYHSKQLPGSIQEDDVASAVTTSELELGEDTETRDAQQKKVPTSVQNAPVVEATAVREGFAEDGSSVDKTSDTQQRQNDRLHGSAIHNIFKRVFPGMSESNMGNLLSKSEEIGIQMPDDFQYLKDADVANELRGTLKIVELKKLLEYVKEEKYKSWTFERSSGIREPNTIDIRVGHADIGHHYFRASTAEERRKGKKN